jgi:hypothetical protein
MATKSPLDLAAEVDARLGQDGSEGVAAFRSILAWADEPSSPPPSRASALECVTRAVSSSTHMLLLARDAGLVGEVIRRLPCIDDDVVFARMAHLLKELGSFAVTAADVKTVFSLVTGKDGGAGVGSAARQETLHETLVALLEAGSPVSSYFWMEGPNSAIEVEAETTFDSKWPSAYAALAWVLFEDLPPGKSAAAPAAAYEPRVLCFVSTAGVGLEVFLQEGALIVRTTPASFCCVPFRFEVGRWYHIVVVHSYSFSGSKMQVYINGMQRYEAAVKYPSCSGILAQRTIGNVS